MPQKKTCKCCGERYEKGPKDPSFKNWCSLDCGAQIARARLEKARFKEQMEAKRRQKKDIAARKKKLKTVSTWTKEAQREFNKFIRLRDYDQPCISCGKERVQIEMQQGWKVGGAWDCGHYLSVGAFPALRFEEDNAHKQCKSCNGGSGRFARKSKSVAESYRINLVKKIGEHRVRALERDQSIRQYRAEDLEAIKIKYRTMARELEKEHADRID